VGEGRRGNSDPISQTVQLRGLRVIEAYHYGINSLHSSNPASCLPKVTKEHSYLFLLSLTRSRLNICVLSRQRC
jgi:hypothetical protein